MQYKRRLLTGVAICPRCGATWELYRLRKEEAVCDCGQQLRVTDLVDDDAKDEYDDEKDN